MNDLKKALDALKNDEKAKKDLHDSVLSKLDSEKRKKLHPSFFFKIAISLLVCIGLLRIVDLYYPRVVNSVSIDVNSTGIQLDFNKAEYVVDYSYNGIAPAKTDYKGLNLNQAVSAIVTDAKNSDLSFTACAVAVVFVQSNNTKNTEILESKVKNIIIESAKEQGAEIAVYCAKPNSQVIEYAMKEGISPGKYYLIKLIQNIEPEYQIASPSSCNAYDLIDIFLNLYEDWAGPVTIKDNPVPLSPGINESITSESQIFHSENMTSDLQNTDPEFFSLEEIFEQYKILSDLTK